ncbi:sensor histidine kinase [Streptomyces profundus]|uniref:sensor histidine kinase n=1 Tax=Streptomyces profundus TaxID=2867410 RepID=UPI001D168EBE|nr:sensor histidine kinase [Streptomyces sp. MA3_2.13]UED84744.1 sensor domain-containing protein [Streptomyces sp. MA3_2.13]
MTVLRLPFTARAWREGLYALLNLPMAIVGFVTAVTGLAVSAGLLITFVGLPLLALTLLWLRTFGYVERQRARLLLGSEVAEPGPVRHRDGKTGLLAWIGAVLRSDVSWRSTAYALLHLPWAIATFTVVVTTWAGGFAALTLPLWSWTLNEDIGINTDGQGNGWIWDNPFELALVSVVGLLLLISGSLLIRGMVAVDRLAVRALLGPSAAASRVSQLEEDRSVVVDTSAADLRRIERDLHDGAQARLVALAMDLGLAKEKLTEDPEAAARMVDEAHGEVKLALQELRDLARGIHPAVLTDRGLGPALSSVAARCTVPVTVDIDLDQRPAPAIEGIAYFTTSELLQNISKHSNAHHATIEIWRTTDRLMIQVTDNGQGGATTTHGTGLAGLTERLTAVDGLLAIQSPHGGPTTITAELPWREPDGSPSGRRPR